MPEEKLYKLVSLGESTELKRDLNRGMASLKTAPESHFRPHLCLNGRDGVKVIGRISADPDQANTEFMLMKKLIVSGNDVWLNVSFYVYIERGIEPTNALMLTPRQTSYIVQHLPPDSQARVLEQVKRWYLGEVVPELTKGLAAITTQLETGDPLIASDHRNHVFDIHGGRSMEVPYTEWDILGENVAPDFLFGSSFLERGDDGYAKADAFLSGNDERRRGAVEAFMGLARLIGPGS